MKNVRFCSNPCLFYYVFCNTNLSSLNFYTNQCYNLLNKVIKHNSPIPSLLPIVRGFLGVTIISYFFLSLWLRSQCANNATIQPLTAVVMMWTKLSSIITPPLYVWIDAWEIGDLYIISSSNKLNYVLSSVILSPCIFQILLYGSKSLLE